MSRRYDRRQLFAAGLGLSGLGRASGARGATAPPPAGELAGAADWARRALEALRGSGARFTAGEDGASCDLGAEGRLEVELTGRSAARVTLVGHRGELEMLRALDTPGVARVEARMDPGALAPAGPCHDTLRRVPGGYELTFSSALALRHAEPKRVPAEPPEVFERLAATAVERARTLLR